MIRSGRKAIQIPCLALMLAPAVCAQTPVQPNPDKVDQAEVQSDPTLKLQAREIETWVRQLGSPEFAARERAADRLMELGPSVIPSLRKVATEDSDAEVRLRAAQVVKQLTRGNMQARIERFLAGEDVNFEGWDFAQTFLGDSTGVRELFVELMQSHPKLPASLRGTPRDRALAMEAVVAKVQNTMFVERKFPSKADAYALLLVAVDPNVPLNASFESVLVSVLKTSSVSQIRKDVQLAAPFNSLLNRWVARSTLASREEVLLLGMMWEIPSSLPVAVRTLNEANQTETLALALQVIARFGNRNHVQVVMPLMDDTRPAAERSYASGEKLRTQLGDVAMATIAILYDVSLADVGFKDVRPHPITAFSLSELAFQVGDDAPREAVRAKVMALLKGVPEES